MFIFYEDVTISKVKQWLCQHECAEVFYVSYHVSVRYRCALVYPAIMVIFSWACIYPQI